MLSHSSFGFMIASEPLASSSLSLQRQYRREGFSIARGYLKPDLLDDVRLAVEDYYRVKNVALSDEVRSHGADYQRLNYDLRQAPASVLELAQHPLLLRLVKTLSRWSEAYLYDYYLFRKPPGAPSTPWHRDGDYLPIDGELCTTWIPLENYDDALIYASGTNRLAPVDALCESSDDLTRLLASPSVRICRIGAMQCGDVDVHNHRVWHMGPGNPTSNFRQAIAFTYVPAGCRVDGNTPGFNPDCGLAQRQSHLDAYFAGQGGMSLKGHHLIRVF